MTHRSSKDVDNRFQYEMKKKRENSSFIYFARVFKSSNLKNDDKSKCFPDDSLSSRPTFFKCRFPVCFSRLLFPSVVNPRTAFLAVGWLRIVAITSRRSNKNSTIVFSSLCLSVCLFCCYQRLTRSLTTQRRQFSIL